MDPLSIATSVAGLIAAGGKLAAILTQISRLSDAPPLCRAVLTEVCDTAAALRQVQNFLDGQLRIPSGGREHVLLEHVATALTGCVMTKDELESLLDGVGLVYAGSGITGIFDRVKWVRKEQDIQRLIQRLQNHKATLNLILTILQCSSFIQVQDLVIRLTGLVEEAVLTSSALSMRLSRLEGSSTLRYPTTETSTINNTESTNGREPGELDGDDASVRTITRDHSQSKGQLALAPFAFDTELQGSRVYRRLELLGSDGHSETSVTTSTRRRAAASIFSALSLAEISNLSQYSLPIFIQEISNSRWYIQIGRLSASSGMVTTASGISFDVKTLLGESKTYTLQPTDTVYQIKEKLKEPPDIVVLVYTEPGGKFLRLQDHKSFEEQGITSTHPGARVHVLPRYRAGGTVLLESGRLRMRDELEFDRFFGG
jgi:hypothetical protein